MAITPSLNLGSPIPSIEEPWHQHTGQEVESFICQQLLEKIVGMEYTDQYELLLHKANGETLSCGVSPIVPEYKYGIKLYGIRVDSDNTKIFTAANIEVTTQYTPNRKIEAGVIMYAISVGNSTNNLIGPFDVKFKLGNTINGTFRVNNIPYEECAFDDGNELIGTIYEQPEDIIAHIAWIDITSLFTTTVNEVNLNARVIASESTQLVALDTLALKITNQKIDLSYASSSKVLEINLALFSLTGGRIQDYHLEGYNNGLSFGRTNNGSLTITTLTAGLNQLVVRAVHNTRSDIYTDWAFVDLIYTKDLEETTVAINNVNSTIPNNGIATLYELTIYSPNLDAATLSTYLESSEPQNNNPLNNVKYEVIGASSYDKDNVYKTSYSKYMEISGVNNQRYLMVKVGDTFYQFYTVFISPSTGAVTAMTTTYKEMTIEKIDDNLTYYQGIAPTLNFDQNTGRSNNVIITPEYADNGLSANVNPNLESSDGWKEQTLTEGGRTLFRMSAQSTPLFTNPIDLNLTNNFTIELGFKTYNVKDLDTPILTIGTFQLRPSQFCFNTNDTSLFNARNAQFRTDLDTHIVMTVHGGLALSKTQPYYPNYLGSYQQAFDTSVAQVGINLVRIYVNGTIDREIIIGAQELSTLRQGKLQINPTACDIDLYLIRVYNNTSLSMDDVLRNYISFLPNKSDKLKVYEANDIVDENTKEISFDKCFGKYNTIVYVLPEGCRFPNRAWGKNDGEAKKDYNKYPVTLFINYINPKVNKEHGGKFIDMTMTAQGSSAMRYLIWNVQSAAGKFKDKRVDSEGNYLDKNGNPVVVTDVTKSPRDYAADLKRKSAFIAYSDTNFDYETNTFKPEATTTYNNYYIMPSYETPIVDDKSKIKKLVGKVNFASSMQSHKAGAIKLYNDAYISANGSLLTGGRKACREEPFLYFYWESPKTSSKSYDVTIEENENSNYWKTRDADSIQKAELAELFNNPDVHFMGFQTWGSAKADDATYGYDEDITPEYLLIEGGENTDAAVQFRVPWHALQRAVGSGSNKSLGNAPIPTYARSLEAPWENLLIDEESIVYHDRGALDVDYGVEELTDDGGKVYFEIAEPARVTLNFYRLFHDFVYTHDYTFITTTSSTPDGWNTYFKYCFSGGQSFTVTLPNGTTKQYLVYKGDVFRYETYSKTWVPAGVSYNGTDWDTLNVFTVAGVSSTYSVESARAEMKNKFMLGIGNYVDLADAAFHQAFVKFLSGTDNRAKNTYFQILGHIKKEVANPEYDAVNNPDVPEAIWVDDVTKDGMKIRFMQDDLDTILLTDNAGLLTKPYNLLEPSYRWQDFEHWGDRGNNKFFYMFDQCFEKVPENNEQLGITDKLTIKGQLKELIHFAFNSDNDVSSSENYFYKAFLSVQDMFPPVAYNHTSQIYYENAEFIMRSGAISSFYGNNNIRPIEQAHGSSKASEIDFMQKRLSFLGSYIGEALGEFFNTASSGAGGGQLKLIMDFVPYQDFYPNYMWDLLPQYLGAVTTKVTDDLKAPFTVDAIQSLLLSYDAIKYLAKADNSYHIELTQESNASINLGIYQLGLYKSLNITGLYYSEFNPNFDHAVDFTIDNANLYNGDVIKPFFGEGYPELRIASFAPSFPVIENLTLNNIKLPDELDLSLFTKLKNVDLTNAETLDVILPESGRLQNVILPETITAFRLYNNPGILSVVFQGIEHLETVYLNCSAVGQFNVDAFLESLLPISTINSVTLINANVKLTEDTVRKLCSLATFRVQGKITIITNTGSNNKKDISLDTKRLLVEKFGNFKFGNTGDPNSKVELDYTETPISAADVSVASDIQLYSDFETDMPNQFNVLVSNGNDVAITYDNNGKPMLNITYTMSGTGISSIATINQYTGVIHLKGLTQNLAIVTTKIVTKSTPAGITKQTNVRFIWSPPAVGDYAYIDGTFSPGYDSNKTLVGLVYAVQPDDEFPDTKGFAYIIGKEYASDTAYYAGYSDEGDVNSSDNIKKDLGYIKTILTEILGSSSLAADYDNVSEIANVSSLQNDISISKLPPSGVAVFKGDSDTNAYITHVSGLLSRLRSDSRFRPYIKENPSTGLWYIESKTNLDNLCEALKGLNKQGMSSSDSDIISCILYPYFYSMYLYEPIKKDDEVISLQYTVGHWYAPSYGELARIAYYRGYSYSGNSFESSSHVRLEINANLKKGSGDMQVPIFSLARSAMGKNDVWNSLFGTSEGASTVNNITTSVSSSATYSNYSYQVVATYNWQSPTTYNTQWIPGSSMITSYDSRYINGWRLTKHKGVPFVKFQYLKA